MAESTEPAKTAEILARDSVYFLSIVAAALQHGHRPLVGETGRNQGAIVAKSKIREGSALTHLSTCLTRGLAGLENSRIIAVAAGPLTSDGITLSVCTSPKESPDSSPTISHSPSTDATSLDVADQASTDVLSRPNSPPQNTGTSIKRNSGIVEAGEVHTVTISASETSSATLDRLLEQDYKIAPSYFVPFVEESLCLLRAASLRQHSGSAAASSIRDAVCIFFLASCLDTIEKRMQALKKSYDWDEIKAWMPTTRDKRAAVPFQIKDVGSIHTLALEAVGLYPLDGALQFPGDTMSMWWKALLFLVDIFDEALQLKDLEVINSLSTRIHDCLKVVPSQLWTRSLGLHLADCRKGKHVPYPSQPASSEKEPEKKEDDDDEAEDENNLDSVLPTETPLDVSANPDCIAFYRAVDAVCAWTTGPTYLLRSPISRAPIPLTVSIVDLPRGAIVDVALDGLLARWKKHSRWSDKTERRVSDILKSARSRDPGRERGACHCEAGLMASILVHRQDSRATQPETLVFPALTDVTTDVIPIGVAKKCCPLCWILADILRSTYKLQIKLPGRHNRYHIWVPPHWLPTQVLESLETEILNVITSMILSKEKTACSRSSPGSDGHQTSPPVYVVGDTKAKQLLKKLW